ncbi:MAG TPA: efflux transporter outer membrane subunit [Terriglobia bacterium]|nr:efflux transporter outer membrane subunit [Terriglobia bacterium]
MMSLRLPKYAAWFHGRNPWTRLSEREMVREGLHGPTAGAPQGFSPTGFLREITQRPQSFHRREARRYPLFLVVAACTLLGGCMMGPNYQRPKVNTPPNYRGPVSPPPPQTSTASLGNEKWWTVFHDPVLQQLVRTALQQNYDVRIAASRILQAQAQLHITRSNEFPTVEASANLLSERSPKINSFFPTYELHTFELDPGVIWNLDFWGKYRRQTEAARDNLLETVWGRRAVMTSVVASVATAYFQLRELDSALAISQRTLTSRRDSLHLTEVLAKYGSASLLDLRQSQELVDTAAEAIPQYEQQIEQQEDSIRDLLGENPGPIPRGLPLTQEPAPPTVPAGLPSELLDRRPDIREAEANLMAANADIGVAKADFFPNISLTAIGGLESYALDRFFSFAQAGMWNATGSATQTIFQAGALRAGLELSQSQEQQMLLSYEQTIKTALQQVSDALIAYQKDREFLKQQQALTNAAADADRLSYFLYRHGGVSYLQVLTSETNYFTGELNLAQAQLSVRLALVQLYNALGGGWQQ